VLAVPTAARRNPWAVAAAATAFLLPIAYSPSVYATFWSPKAAVLLVAAAIGLTRVPPLLRSERRAAAIAALAFLAVAALATIASPDRTSALFGLYNSGTGLVFVAALVGAWALGASVAPDDALVRRALLGGILFSCAVAILQSVVDLGLPALVANGRASGLAGNAVHLGTIAVAGVVLLAYERNPIALGGIVVCGAAVQLSGTRLALIVLLVAVVVIGVRAGVRRLVVLVAVTGFALVLGNVLASSAGLQTATARSDERALSSGTGGGVRVRVDVWSYARHAVLGHPALGAGPGRFRAATVADRTLPVVRAEGSGAVYADGHNLLVEYAVTTGLLGVAALLAWLVLGLRPARGPLAAASLALLAMSLGQPQSVGTTPLLLLAMGAASAPVLEDRGRRAAVAAVVAGAVGAMLAALLLVGDASLLRLRQDFHLADGRRADALLHPWPQPAQLVARAHRFRSLGVGTGRAQRREQALARHWLWVALQRDRADPGLWADLGDAERHDDLPDDARRHYLEAIRRDPYQLQAMRGLAAIAKAAGDRAQARTWLERTLAIIDDPHTRRQIDELG
jgi:hypothetical protein